MKVAIVTGASKGIGEAVSYGLAQDGFELALAARSAERLEEVSRRIKDAGGENAPEVVVVPLDMRDGSSVEALVATVIDRFGRIDLLFNNAGVFHKGTVDLAYERFVEMLEVNLQGAFRMLQAVVPVMKRQKSGTIINLASRSGKIASAAHGAYAATKFGLVGLNESLYRELSAEGIRVTAICPGWVNTDMAAYSGLAPEAMIQTSDIVQTIRWIMSLSPSVRVKEVCLEALDQVR